MREVDQPERLLDLPDLRDGILVAVLAELLALDLLELVLPDSPLVFRSIRICLYL